MNPIRQKMLSFLTEAARKEIEALAPESPYAKELSKIDDIEKTIAEEIEKICSATTLAEVTRALLLARRPKKVSGREKEKIKSEFKSIAEKLITRVETKSGPLKLSEACPHLFSEL